MTTPDIELTIEQIQGRLNQREIPWRAAPVRGEDPAVRFKPNDGRAVSVAWDRGHEYAPSFEAIVEFLASYVPER